jgi:hypothetical protein
VCTISGEIVNVSGLGWQVTGTAALTLQLLNFLKNTAMVGGLLFRDWMGNKVFENQETKRAIRSRRNLPTFRELGLTTIFGNVGSTEGTFLKNFPKDPLCAGSAGSICDCNCRRLCTSDTPSGVGEPARARVVLVESPVHLQKLIASDSWLKH